MGKNRISKAQAIIDEEKLRKHAPEGEQRIQPVELPTDPVEYVQLWLVQALYYKAIFHKAWEEENKEMVQKLSMNKINVHVPLKDFAIDKARLHDMVAYVKAEIRSRRKKFRVVLQNNPSIDITMSISQIARAMAGDEEPIESSEGNV